MNNDELDPEEEREQLEDTIEEQGPNPELAKDSVKQSLDNAKRAKEAVQKAQKVEKAVKNSNKIKAAAKFASGAKKFALLANPYFWIGLLIILALIVLIGIIMSFTIMPSNFIGKTKKFTEKMMQNFCSFVWGDATSPISNDSEDVKDLANYIQNMGYDIQGYGFGDVEYTKETNKQREEVRQSNERANAIEGKRNYVTESQATQGGEIKKVFGLTSVTTVSTTEFKDGDEMYRITGRFSSKNNDYLRAYLSAEAATYTEATYSIKGIFNELGDLIKSITNDVFGGKTSSEWEDPGDVGAKASSTGMLNFTNAGGNNIFNSTLGGSPTKIKVDPKKKKLMLYEKALNLGVSKFNWGHTFSVDLSNWTAIYGRPLELFLALHLSSMMPDLPYQLAVDQAFNTKVNISLQDVRLFLRPEIRINGHEVNINGCDIEEAGDEIKLTDINGNRFTAKMDEEAFKKIKKLIAEATAPDGVIHGVLEGYSDTFINTSASGYRATQAGFCDGEYMIVTQNTDFGHEDSNHGGRIAWYSMATRKVEHELLIGEEGGHMEGFAYDWDRHMILKQVEGTTRFIQVDNETRNFASPRYCSVSVKCRQYTFDKDGHQLIGIGGSTLYFFKYNSSSNNYDTIGSVPLQDYHLVAGNLQGIGTDGLEVYLADSSPEVDRSLYRVFTYDLTGRKTGEYTIGDGFGGQAEVETLTFDSNGNLWVLMPGGWFKAKPLENKGIAIKFPYIESVTNHWYYHTIDFIGTMEADTPYGAYKRVRTAQKIIQYADEDADLADCDVELTAILTSGSGIFYQVCEPYLNKDPNIYLKKIFHGIYYKYDGTTETARKIAAARAIEAAYETDNYNNKKFEKDPQKIVDRRIKYNWHSEGSGSSKLEVNLEDATEYVRAKKAQVKIREESDALITIDNEKIKGSNGASVNGFLDAAKEVAQFVDKNNFVYGHAENMPPKADGTTNADGSKKISCDRLVAWALHKIGFTDQPACGLTVMDIPKYGDKHGWKKITNISDVQAGDIVLIGSSESNLRHTFICAGKDKRYDCGSDARIRLEGQYSGYSSQPFNEPIGTDFVCAYRISDTIEAPEEVELIEYTHKEAEEKIKDIDSRNGILELDELGEESPMCKKLVDFKSNKSNTLEAFSILENVNSEAADVNYRLLKKLMIEMDYYSEDEMTTNEKNILLWVTNVPGTRGETVVKKIEEHLGQTTDGAYKTISDTSKDSNKYGIQISNFMENTSVIAPGDAKVKNVGTDEHGSYIELEFKTLTDDKQYPVQGQMMLLHQDDEKNPYYNRETKFDKKPEYSAVDVMRKYRFKDTYQVFNEDDVVGLTMRISGLHNIKFSVGQNVLRGQTIADNPEVSTNDSEGDTIYIEMKKADKTKIDNIEDYINPIYTYEDEKEMAEQLWYLEHPEHGNKYSSGGEKESDYGKGSQIIQGANNEETIWFTLIGIYGYSPEGAAAIMGNWYCESGLNPNNAQNTYNSSSGMSDEEITSKIDSGAISKDSFVNTTYGYGLGQWTYWSRKQAMYEYMKSAGLSIADLGGQIAFANIEHKNLNCYHDLTGKGTKRSDIYNLTERYHDDFEKSATRNIDDRAKAALEIYDRNINKQIPKPSSDSGNAPTGAGFDLEHAKNVSAQIHAKEHKNLDWHGKIIDRNGGMIGAYVEAINILNGTDYTLKEIYDKITSAHPEQKHKNHPVYENEDINDYYNISVSREDPTIENIKKALSEGKLVAEIVNTTKWRDEHGKLYGKTGRHTGLIFYYDGTYFHMKTSVKKDAIYTEAQLREWLGHTKTKLIVYSRK